MIANLSVIVVLLVDIVEYYCEILESMLLSSLSDVCGPVKLSSRLCVAMATYVHYCECGMWCNWYFSLGEGSGVPCAVVCLIVCQFISKYFIL